MEFEHEKKLNMQTNIARQSNVSKKCETVPSKIVEMLIMH